MACAFALAHVVRSDVFLARKLPEFNFGHSREEGMDRGLITLAFHPSHSQTMRAVMAYVHSPSSPLLPAPHSLHAPSFFSPSSYLFFSFCPPLLLSFFSLCLCRLLSLLLFSSLPPLISSSFVSSLLLFVFSFLPSLSLPHPSLLAT